MVVFGAAAAVVVPCSVDDRQVEHMAVDETEENVVEMVDNNSHRRHTDITYGQGHCDKQGFYFYYYVPLSAAPQQDLYGSLVEAVAMEQKYQPALTLPPVPKDSYEITTRMRNGSCHVLRCLRVWYELPSDAFFLAVNLMDRFLTKMRAQPKHLSCIAVAAFSLGASEICYKHGIRNPSRESISVISQSKCTTNDMMRMEDIIRRKLQFEEQPPWVDNLPITPVSMLKLLHAGYCKLLEANVVGGSAPPALLPLIYKLEMVMCDTRLANIRASMVALALFKTQASLHDNCLQPLVNACKVSTESLAPIEALIDSALRDYYGPQEGGDRQQSAPREEHYKQRLVWKLSNRTLRQLKPTSRLRKQVRRLSTIIESPVDEQLLEELTEDEQMETEESERVTEEQEEEEQKKDDEEEKSYCQVAKKRREKSATRGRGEGGAPLTGVVATFTPPPYSATIQLQSSPLSKITLTSQLPKKSSVVQNLSKWLCEEFDETLEDEQSQDQQLLPYDYHHKAAKFLGIVEGVDGDISAAQVAKQKLGGGKRRKRKELRLGLFIRYDTSSDTLLSETANASSGEEDMEDSDYEKDFPPLPVPRSPPKHLSFILSPPPPLLPPVISISPPKTYSSMALSPPNPPSTALVAFTPSSGGVAKNKKNKSQNTSNKKSKKSSDQLKTSSIGKAPSRKKIQKRARKIAMHH